MDTFEPSRETEKKGEKCDNLAPMPKKKPGKHIFIIPCHSLPKTLPGNHSEKRGPWLYGDWSQFSRSIKRAMYSVRKG